MYLDNYVLKYIHISLSAEANISNLLERIHCTVRDGPCQCPKYGIRFFFLCAGGRDSLKSSILVTRPRFGSLSFALDMCIWYTRAVQAWSTFFPGGDELRIKTGSQIHMMYICYKMIYNQVILHNRHNTKLFEPLRMPTWYEFHWTCPQHVAFHLHPS